MHRTFLLVFASLFALGGSLCGAEAIKHEVKVGSQPLVIPAPEGFVRMDGVNAEVDQVMGELVAATNRSLFMFGPAEIVATLRLGGSARISRNFSVQTPRRLENLPVTPSEFEVYRRDAEKDLERLDQRTRAMFGKLGADASKSLSEKMQNEVQVKVGDPIPLGIFERTRDSLGFSMMLKTSVAIAGNENARLAIVSAMLVRVKDRILYLYVSSDRKSDADEAWVKSEVLKWRDAIFAANSQVDAPASSPASRLLQQFTFQRILVALGVAVGLAIYFLRRHQKPTPPPTA